MDAYWTMVKSLKTSDQCPIQTSETSRADFIVKGRVPLSSRPDTLVRYWAAAPADRMTTFAGSGLPFPNPEQAFENTPNKGTVRAENGRFTIGLRFPNSFYVNLGKTLLPPHVLLKFCDNSEAVKAVVLGQGIPNRSLSSLPGNYTRQSFQPREWDDQDLARFSPTIPH